MALLNRILYGHIAGTRRMHASLMRHFSDNTGNTTWFRSRFQIPQDTRIIPQVLFNSLTFVFSIIALRMSYTGFLWVQERAHNFHNTMERVCQLLEEQSESEKDSKVTNIKINGDENEIEQLEKEILELAKSHFNQQDDIIVDDFVLV